MTANEVIDIAAVCRRLQREFYGYKSAADRPPGLLKQCKDAEKRLDDAIKAWKGPR